MLLKIHKRKTDYYYSTIHFISDSLQFCLDSLTDHRTCFTGRNLTVVS